MTCRYYIDKPLNLNDGYGESCTHVKSPDTICPFYGDIVKCDIGESLEFLRNNNLDADYYKKLLMIFLGNFNQYTNKDIARILTKLAIKADNETTIITTQKGQLK